MKKTLLAIAGMAVLGGAAYVFLAGGDSGLPGKASGDADRMAADRELQPVLPGAGAARKPALPGAVPNGPVIKQPEAPAPKAYRFGAAETVLANKLELELGRAAAYNTVLDRTSGPWRLVCGIPTETAGQPFDYKRSKLKKDFEAGYLEGRFCALFKDRATGQELVAFDVGSTDNYIAGWAEKLDLPSALTD